MRHAHHERSVTLTLHDRSVATATDASRNRSVTRPTDASRDRCATPRPMRHATDRRRQRCHREAPEAQAGQRRRQLLPETRLRLRLPVTRLRLECRAAECRARALDVASAIAQKSSSRRRCKGQRPARPGDDSRREAANRDRALLAGLPEHDSAGVAEFICLADHPSVGVLRIVCHATRARLPCSGSSWRRTTAAGCWPSSRTTT